jgi:hypothetical protein
MRGRIGSLAVLGLALIVVFLVFGIDVRNLDDLWAAIQDFWSLVSGVWDNGVQSTPAPKPPGINLPTPRLPD